MTKNDCTQAPAQEGLPGEDVDTRKSAVKGKASRAAARQAIILVHGMGEQIPMDAIKGFVKTLWQDEGDARTHQVWSKPDERTGSLELRRITTRNSKKSSGFANGVRSDFFELYWADLTAGSTWDQFTGWLRPLLLRPLSKVPQRVRLAWGALWFATLFILCMGSIGLVPKDIWVKVMPGWLPQGVVLGLAVALTGALHKVTTRTFGRVVRYTRAEPANIAARAAVRERGLKLLRAVHAGDKYDRVILVGHSLGSILAYDLLSYFWAEKSDSTSVVEKSAAFDALCRVEKAAALLEKAAEHSIPAATAKARLEYRQAQADLWRSLAAGNAGSGKSSADGRWLISDFVTFGSPLTHTEFLLASGREDLKDRQRARELPTAPPVREELEPATLSIARESGMLDSLDAAEPPTLMSFTGKTGTAGKDAPRLWTVHHGGPFAVVRWTNVFDPARAIYKGDLIGGPLAATFGPAIEDIDLSSVDGRSGGFTHTRYWDAGQSEKRKELFRKSVNLLNEDIDWRAY
jgi:hypothetical protein